MGRAETGRRGQGGRAETGRRGEDAACRYLAARGHVILERNWRSGHWEIDIITLAQDGLHIVEVKTRVAPVAAQPEENVRYGKQRNLVAAAQRYLHNKNDERLSGLEVFFDVIAITLDEGAEEIAYFPQAFLPIYV